MLTPVYDENRIQIFQGDTLTTLRQMPSDSVHCVVTSPPYHALRSYLDADAADKQFELGSEAVMDCLGWATGSPCHACFICKMVAVFEEVRRVLHPSGVAWVNMGNSYACTPNGRSAADTKKAGRDDRTFRDKPSSSVGNGLKPKDLTMQGERLAMAMQAAGWWLRSETVLCKRSPMPESTTDRPTSAHEKLFLFAKRANYFYDADAVRIRTGSEMSAEEYEQLTQSGKSWASGGKTHPAGRNAWNYIILDEPARDWFLLSSEPSPEAHYATFPTAIPKRAILSGSSERGVCEKCLAPFVRVVEKSGGAIGKSWHNHEADSLRGNRKAVPSEGYKRTEAGWTPSCACPSPVAVPATILDPFAGSGTSLLVARMLGRRGIGIELSPCYVDICRRRLAQTCLDLEAAE